MSKTNIHEFLKSLKIRSSARHLAHNFEMLFHFCIPSFNFLPRIHDSRFWVER